MLPELTHQYTPPRRSVRVTPRRCVGVRETGPPPSRVARIESSTPPDCRPALPTSAKRVSGSESTQPSATRLQRV